MLTAISGSYMYCPQDGTGFQHGVERGQVVDLSNEDVAREISRGVVELKLDGPIGRAFDPGYIAAQRAQLRA